MCNIKNGDENLKQTAHTHISIANNKVEQYNNKNTYKNKNNNGFKSHKIPLLKTNPLRPFTFKAIENQNRQKQKTD